MSIEFNKEDHSYYNKGKEGSEKDTYTSVSTLIANYKVPFRKDFWSTHGALKRIMSKKEWANVSKGFKPWDDALIIHAQKFVDEDELIKVRDQILKEWDENNKKSISKGNKYHNAKEQISYKKGYEINPFTGNKVDLGDPNYKMFEDTNVSPEKGSNYLDKKVSLTDNLYELEDGFYPELLIWNDENMIAGQADKIFIETDPKSGIRYVDVDDYKTNKKIKTTSFFNRTMKPPLDHIPSSNYYAYKLQISTYAWMMEQFGYEVRNTAFHHFNKKYQFDYMKKEVEDVIKDFRNK